MENLRSATVWQRRLVFLLFFGGGIMALIAVTWLLANQAINGGQRAQGYGFIPGALVTEFATLPDDDSYPAAVAAAPDGTIYTGSFATGAIWSITPDGVVSEVPGSRDEVGALMGIAVAPDGSLLVVDQLDTDPRSSGGKVLRLADGAATTFADVGFTAPNDITLDAAGHVYVSDPGSNQVWRFDADGANGTVWWVPPATTGDTRRAITGLAYDPSRDAIVITDPELNDIFRVSLADNATELIYQHGDRQNPPGFDGATVTPDGTLYVAALGQNGIVQVNDGKLEYIAGRFRGASDVEFVAPNLLYVTNFDQSSIVLPIVHAQLPFALDRIELSPAP